MSLVFIVLTGVQTDTYYHACFHVVNFQLVLSFIFYIFLFLSFETFLQIMTMNHLVDSWSTIFFYSEVHLLILSQSLQVLCCLYWSSLWGLVLGRQTLTLDAQESLNVFHLYTIVRKFS